MKDRIKINVKHCSLQNSIVGNRLKPEPPEPRSYISAVRNVAKGVQTRTMIIRRLERKMATAREIAESIGRSYTATLEQLRKMERSGVVARLRGRPSLWRLTGRGQQKLT